MIGKAYMIFSDQRLTRDIENWTKLCGTILTKLFSSPLTVIYYTGTTYYRMGWQGPVMCYLYFLIGSFFNQILINPIVALWYTQEVNEGNFRFSHMTVRANAESVAFYRGQERELELNRAYLARVIKNKWKIIARNIPLNLHMSLFGYVGGILNYLILGVCVFWFGTFKAGSTPSETVTNIAFVSV